MLVAVLFSVVALGLPQEVPETPVCPDCKVQLRPVVTLGSERDSVLVGPTGFMVRNSGGEYLLVHQNDAARISVFGPAGTGIRHVGREGMGPGEYKYILGLTISPGDTLHVFDYGLRRHTVLSPSLEVVRTIPMPVPLFPDGARILSGDVLAVNGAVPTSAAVGFPLHLVSATTGEVIGSFGADNQTYVRGRTYLERKLALSLDGHLWVAHWNRYLIEQWDSRGRKVSALAGRRAWFQDWDQWRPPSAKDPPLTVIAAVRQDRQGLLWVLSHVPDRAWRRGVEQINSIDGRLWRIADRDAAYDTVIEVIAPLRAAVLSVSRFPQYLTGFVDDSTVFGNSESDDGFPQIDIWRVTLTKGAP